jgi:hypothetical protein
MLYKQAQTMFPFKILIIIPETGVVKKKIGGKEKHELVP